MLTMLKGTAGQTLQHARFRAGLTLRQLSDKADVAVATIVNIEQGNRATPHGRTVYKIAEALGIDPESLFEREAAS